MLNVLLASGHVRTPRPILAGLLSACAHAAVAAAMLVGTGPAIRGITRFETRFAQYLFPLERSDPSRHEGVTYVSTLPAPAHETSGAGGFEDASQRARVRPSSRQPSLAPESSRGAAPTLGADAVRLQEEAAAAVGAFSVLDVDSAALRDPRSAAPTYPRQLEERGIEGSVRARFVVDSTGLVDMATVKIMEASNPLFVRAVMEALPGMRFRPAMVRAQPVRQLAEQEFSFRLQRPGAVISVPAPVVRKP